jgi:hypothetical protein
MPWYKNEKPGILGLEHAGEKGAGPQLVKPGEVFEADAKSIPKAYFDNKWIVPAQKPAESSAPSPTADDVPPTDADAASSKANEAPATTAAERAALRAKEGEASTADDDKNASSKKPK